MEKENLIKQILYACDMPVSYDTKKAIIEEFLGNFEKEVSPKTALKVLEKTRKSKGRYHFKHWKRAENILMRKLIKEKMVLKHIIKNFPQYTVDRIRRKYWWVSRNNG